MPRCSKTFSLPAINALQEYVEWTWTPALNRMPLELWEEVLGHIPNTDLAMLKSMSEVSPDLCLPARKRFFRKMHLAHLAHVIDVAILLAKTPALASVVVQLQINLEETAMHSISDTDHLISSLSSLVASTVNLDAIEMDGTLDCVILGSHIASILDVLPPSTKSVSMVDVKICGPKFLFLSLTARGIHLRELLFKRCIVAANNSDQNRIASRLKGSIAVNQNKGKLFIGLLKLVDCIGMSATISRFLAPFNRRPDSSLHVCPWEIETLYFREESNAFHMEIIVDSQKMFLKRLCGGIVRRNRSVSTEELFFTIMEAYWAEFKHLQNAEVEVDLGNGCLLLVTLTFLQGQYGFTIEEKWVSRQLITRATVRLETETEVWRALGQACDYAHTAKGLVGYVKLICDDEGWDARLDTIDAE